MTIVYNGTTLGKPVYNGVTIDKVIYNGTTVLGVPVAPTIGTATKTGVTTATVAFTAGADYGYTASVFTATSSPGSVVNTGSSSPINMTGLTGSTSYTFTVTATNTIGTSLASGGSNSITTDSAAPTVIGQAFGGGYYAGKINDGGTLYYLIVAPKSSGETTGKTWGTYGTTTGITSVIAGPTNTNSLNALGSSYQAAQYCKGLSIGGFTDWYLPAKNELEVLYFFLKPGTTSNSAGYGSNANAVSPEPVSTNYSAGTPAQTSATTFRTGASSQEFVENFYWSSTENNANYAWVQYFYNGSQYSSNKGYTTSYVRAVRRFAV